MAAYVRSVIWLFGCSGIGYVLLVTINPSLDEEYLTKARQKYPGTEKSPVESSKLKQQLVDVLRAASETDKPVCRLNKDELGNLRRQEGLVKNDKDV